MEMDADESDDELKFAAGPDSYKPDESQMLIPPKEAAFREYLCDSKATEEIVRLLVGLAEMPEKPDDPVSNWRAAFDVEAESFGGREHLLTGFSGPDMVTSRPKEDIPALLAENDTLREREATLSAQVAEAVTKVDAMYADAAAAVLDALAGGAFASDAVEGGLDVAKLCARADRDKHQRAAAAHRPSPRLRPLFHAHPRHPPQPHPPQPHPPRAGVSRRCCRLGTLPCTC